MAHLQKESTPPRPGGAPHPHSSRLKARQGSAPPSFLHGNPQALYTATNWMFTTPPGPPRHLNWIPLGVTWLLFRGDTAKCHQTHRRFLLLWVKKSFWGLTAVTLPPPLLRDAAKQRGGVMKEIKTDNTDRQEPDTPAGPVERCTSRVSMAARDSGSSPSSSHHKPHRRALPVTSRR